MQVLLFLGLFAAASAHFINEYISASYYEDAGPRKMVCYYDRTSTQNRYFEPKKIKATLCTHLIYAYVGINPDGTLQIDYQTDIEQGGFKKVVKMSQYDNPYMKTLLGIRDNSEKNNAFSIVLRSHKRRTTFVNNILNLLKRHKFEGVEINWARPAKYGGVEDEKALFAAFLKELYLILNPSGYLVTVALNPHVSFLDTSYSIPILNKYTNLIVLRTDDYLEGWDCLTTFQSPLYNTHQYLDDQVLNVNSTVQHWLQLGVNYEKLVLTIPLNGITFTLRDATQNGVDKEVTGPGTTLGLSSQKSGILYYSEICGMMTTGSGWTEVLDPQAKVYYAYNGDQWMSYETMTSVKTKAHYIKMNDLGGSAIWAVHMDDFQNTCGKGKYPLMHMIKKIQQ